MIGRVEHCPELELFSVRGKCRDSISLPKSFCLLSVVLEGYRSVFFLKEFIVIVGRCVVYVIYFSGYTKL